MAVSPDPSETVTLEKILTLEKGYVVRPPTLNIDPSMKMMIVHRNTGSPCLINILLSYPSSAPTISHIKARVMDVQAAWPFLSYTVIDQRTPNPKFLCRTSPWIPDRLVFEATYTASGDPSVDLNKVYDHALRSCLVKTDLEEGPLWSVRVYTAETGRTYICVVADHCFIDGRGTIRLAKSIAGSDNLNFSHETQEFYAAVPPMADGRAPTSFILREACSMFILPHLPTFLSKRLGYVASWPTRFRRKPIDTRWRSSILSIDSAQMLALKERAREHGVGTLNPILYAIYCVAHWCTFRSPHAYKTATVKDLRRKEDPYCVGNRLTLIRYTHHCHASMSVWDLAREYAEQVLSPEKAAEGLNLFRALNMLKDRPVDPRRSLPTPSLDELPVGDKRAHTKLEALALQGIHARKPKPGLSGIWSNAGYWALPPNADDLVFGVNGSHSAALFNVLLTGHENGVRMQIAYSDGACMDKSEVDQLEARIVTVISRLVAGCGSDTFAGLCEP